MNFKDYHFITEQANAGGLTSDIKNYIDDKFKDIETRLVELGADSLYNVLPAGNGVLDIIDIDKQLVAGKLSYPGELISAPVVHGNKVSFGIQERRGDDKRQVLGVIYELPTGNNLGTFRVEQDDPDNVYKTIMGSESEWERHEPEDEFDSGKKEKEAEEEKKDDVDDDEDTYDIHDDEYAKELERQRQEQELEDLRSDVDAVKQQEIDKAIKAKKEEEDKKDKPEPKEI